MKVYETGQIRNVAIVAHGGAGKTSLAEAMLFHSGAIKRLGKVDEGNTTTDYFAEEIKRKVTINTALAPCEWKEHKINFIDTPGYADFIGDVIGALRVTDGVLFVFDAVSGVEVQSEIIWEYADNAQLPRIAFVNKMDRENANFYNVLNMMQKVFNKKIVALQIPIGAEESFRGCIDLIKMKAFIGGKEEEIPAELQEEAGKFREALVEAVAEEDDELLMKYLEGEELDDKEIEKALQESVLEGKLVPVLCGSALQCIGIEPLMNAVVGLLPSPLKKEILSAEELLAKPLAALVFKTLVDPFVGRVSLFRVFSGTLKSSTVYNVQKDADEKITQVVILRGKEQIPVTELKAGDIGAVTKLQVTQTGDTLTDKNNPVKLEGIVFLEPTLPVAISPKSKGDEDKLSNGIAKLLEEDQTLKMEKNTETKEIILSGMGELHLDVVWERLKNRFGLEVEMSTPKVPYRETIRSAVNKVEGKHKKQTGGHGQYGHVFLNIEPVSDKDFVFEEVIFGGAVPKQYIPAVEKGVREKMMEGPLAGYPMTNVKVTLVDGSYHPVDSSEMAFKVAGALAFRKGVETANPVLLEPIMEVEVTVPEQFMGDIIGDLNGKRGRVLGMEPQDNKQVIRALVPLAEMYRYAIDLRSITQGRGSFKMKFSSYEEVPQQIAEKVIEEANSEKE